MGEWAQDQAAAERARFDARYPEYAATGALDELRARDFARLDAHGHVYLDYTGGALYAQSQLRAHLELLGGGVFGNPHSESPAARRSSQLGAEARAAVLAFCHADADEYDVVFTANASAALRIVGESYPFAPGGRFLQTVDNHNSVNGLREFAKRAGADVRLVASRPPAMHLDGERLGVELAARPAAPSLFAYPAQSNFTGVQHDLAWVAAARRHGWHVVLDATAFVPTNRLDLGVVPADFVPLSFYKICGWPTGVGALVARKEALAILRKPWFAGGTVWAVGAQADWHILAPGHEAFEDGTLDYLSLPAVTIGLGYVERAGRDAVHARVGCLTAWLVAELAALRHADGRPAVALYGPPAGERRGATVAFNFVDRDGHIVDERLVERAAVRRNISLRTGCFCNPGSAELVFGVSGAGLGAGFDCRAPLGFDDLMARFGLESSGAVRVSLGLASNWADVRRFLELAQSFVDAAPDGDGEPLPPRKSCAGTRPVASR